MAKTLAKMIDSIKIDLKVFSDDDPLANLDEFIGDKIASIRQTLIREEFNAKRRLDASYYQMVDCLTPVCHTKSCTIDGVTFSFKGELHMVTLPSLVTELEGSEISYLGLQNFVDNFTRVGVDGLSSIIHSRFSKDLTVWARVSNYALIKNLPANVGVIAGIMVLDNPITLCNYTSTSVYPVPSEYKLELLVKKDILSTWNIPYDEVNDARGTIILPRQKQNA